MHRQYDDDFYSTWIFKPLRMFLFLILVVNFTGLITDVVFKYSK